MPGPPLAHGDAAPRPPLTSIRLLTSWDVDPLLLAILLTCGLLYLFAVRRLRRRGDVWSRWRTVLWFAGLGTIFVATSSVVGAYDTILFSAHSVQHMLLQMLAPVPLGMAAPITLALRTLRRRPRALVLAVLHSRVARVSTHPVVAFSLFVVTPFALYYSSLYELTLRNDLVHNINHVHFVVVGSLLYWPLLGVDPLPNPLPYVYRLLMVFGLGPMHVVLGIPIMMSSELIAGGFYRELNRTWGPTLLEDQRMGGAILWVFADVMVLFFLMGLLSQWYRSDERDARRIDRKLDRRYGADARTTPPWWLDTRSRRSPTARHPSGPSPPEDSPQLEHRVPTVAPPE